MVRSTGLRGNLLLVAFRPSIAEAVDALANHERCFATPRPPCFLARGSPVRPPPLCRTTPESRQASDTGGQNLKSSLHICSRLLLVPPRHISLIFCHSHSYTNNPPLLITRRIPPIQPQKGNHPLTHASDENRNHGRSSAPVQVHVPLLDEDVPGHPPSPLDVRSPGLVALRRQHVQPADHCAPLPRHGQGLGGAVRKGRPDGPRWRGGHWSRQDLHQQDWTRETPYQPCQRGQAPGGYDL